MDRVDSAESPANAYELLFQAASMIPIWHYFLAFQFVSFVFLYNFLEIHFFQDLFSGFRGNPVSLTFNSCSDIYDGVVSKCRVLRGRYLATPWLSSPHFQTAFLHFFGRPPVFSYRRQLFHASDGGTVALDWLLNSDVLGGAFHMNNTISKDDTTPVVVVIPGLTSDSASAYIKHIAFNMAKRGWNVVVSNHRGLGGVSITSDCFYNAGWTEDVREVIDYLHQEYPEAPLFAVGTSIGANILVKYLGEDGENVPIAGAAAICSPWDLLDIPKGCDMHPFEPNYATSSLQMNYPIEKLTKHFEDSITISPLELEDVIRLRMFQGFEIGDRFISRRLLQKFYDKALTIGLQGYAQLHQPHYSRLADWEGIKKSRSIRDFDNYATCLVGKFETVDTYYRRCSSTSFVGNVSVPLLCISALDDPVCTREAIPWDECRANKNIVLATTMHGGHLAFFEGIAAAGVWWVRAVDEFLGVLHSSPFMHRQKKTQNSGPHSSLESSIDQGPFVHVAEGGLVAAIGNEVTTNDVVGDASEVQKFHGRRSDILVQDTDQDDNMTEAKSDLVPDITQSSKQATSIEDVRPLDVATPIRRRLDQLSQHNTRSMWLLAYVAILTSWPLVGSALQLIFKKKIKNVLPAALLRR